VRNRSELKIPEERPPREAWSLIERNRSNPDCVVVDVREPAEYQGEHIEGARNLDYHRSTFADDLGQLDRLMFYVLYCRRGVRAAQARKLMKEKGFTRVCCVQGGIDRWKAEGFPVKEGPQSG